MPWELERAKERNPAADRIEHVEKNVLFPKKDLNKRKIESGLLGVTQQCKNDTWHREMHYKKTRSFLFAFDS